jgi:hypothetical protein
VLSILKVSGFLKVKGLDDASNFEYIEEEPSGPNIESLRNVSAAWNL